MNKCCSSGRLQENAFLSGILIYIGTLIIICFGKQINEVILRHPAVHNIYYESVMPLIFSYISSNTELKDNWVYGLSNFNGKPFRTSYGQKCFGVLKM